MRRKVAQFVARIAVREIQAGATREQAANAVRNYLLQTRRANGLIFGILGVLAGGIAALEALGNSGEGPPFALGTAAVVLGVLAAERSRRVLGAIAVALAMMGALVIPVFLYVLLKTLVPPH